MNRINYLGLLTAWILSIQISLGQQKPLQKGIWRGMFKIEDKVVPVNFELVNKEGKDTFIAINGERRDDFSVDYIGKDSLHILPATFEYKIFAKINSVSSISGVYRSTVPGSTGRIIPFEAQAGVAYRFKEASQMEKPSKDITGKWRITLKDREGDGANRVGIFEQKGNQLTGIILSITGDTRELEGMVEGNKFALSGFTGSGVTLVEGNLVGEELQGTIGFGKNAIQFTGVKDTNAALANAYELTYLKPGYEKLELSMPDLNGNTVTLNDEKYKGKVVILELLGSWCPNCIDQIEFLSPWYKANKHRGVEVIGAAFEAKDYIEFAKKVLGKLITKHDITYDIVFGGRANNEVVASKFEALNTFLAFPTTIVIGRDGKVKKIHTGFSGKGTGEFYKEFVEKWEADMNKIIAEPQP